MLQSTNQFTGNRERFLAQLPENSIAVVLAGHTHIRSGDTPFPFCQDKNFYYLTGYDFPDSILLCINIGQRKDIIFYIEEIDAHLAHWIGNRPNRENARDITGIRECRLLKNFAGDLARYVPFASHCYVNFYPSPIHTQPEKNTVFADNIRSSYPHLQLHNTSEILHRLRMIKSDWEVDQIREAIRITWEGIESVLRNSRPGMSEYQLEAYFNLALHLQNVSSAFPSIIASGVNATILHYTSKQAEIGPDDLVLLDLGAEYRHYSADISRTFPISGKFDAFSRDVYQLVLDANIQTINAARPGLSMKQLDTVSRDIITAGLMDMKIISEKNEVGKYFTHSVSHQLGLDTHDVTDSMDTVLAPGMVVTIEPGVYLRDRNLGVRIEDDILITEDGSENLSESLPKEPAAIESLIRS